MNKAKSKRNTEKHKTRTNVIPLLRGGSNRQTPKTKLEIKLPLPILESAKKQKLTKQIKKTQKNQYFIRSDILEII